MASILLVAAFLCCVVCFEWARRRYFRRVGGTTRFRGGLSVLGPLFVLVNFVFIAAALGTASSARQVIATILLLSCLVLFLWSLGSHRIERPAIAFSSEAPRRLTFDGPYRWVRHPIYLSYMGFWSAGAIMSPLVGVVILLIMCFIYVGAARREECEIMLSALAGQYCVYRSVTGMFFPKSVRGFSGSNNRDV